MSKKDGGYPLPATIRPEGRRYFCVPVPDDPGHLAAFHGAMWDLTRWYKWQRDDDHRGKEAADMWLDIVEDELSFVGLENCGESMGIDCSAIFECTDMLNLLKALDIDITLVEGENVFINNIAGNILAAEKTFEEEITIAGCDQDALWAGCLSLVQFSNRAIIDMFELVEATSNGIEAADQILSRIPTPVTVVLGVVAAFIDAYNEWTWEAYDASYTEDLEHAMACDLMCLFADDCVISMDDIYEYYQRMIGKSIPQDLNGFMNFIIELLLSQYEGPIIVYIHFALLFGFARVLNLIGNTNYTADRFVTWFFLGANSPDNDWTLLCDDPCYGLWCFTNFSDEGAQTAYDSGWKAYNANVPAISAEKISGITIGNNQYLQAELALFWTVSEVDEMIFKFKFKAGNALPAGRKFTVQLLQDDTVTQTWTNLWWFTNDTETINTFTVNFGALQWNGLPFNKVRINANVRSVSGGYLHLISAEFHGNKHNPSYFAPPCY